MFLVNLPTTPIALVSFASLAILAIRNNLAILKKEKIASKGIIAIRSKIFSLKNLILFFEIMNLTM
ncbi:hypothetical protein YM392_1627 [Enterococcus faecalis]|nr:hypothetical protein YM392_1627 [Enterococcus faecalis]